MGRVRLDCPLCGTVVSDEPAPPAPGRCPGCGARFEGGGERPQAAAAAALASLAVPGDPDALARALFEDDTAELGVAVTSDRRDGFYGWWVFVADDPAAAETLTRLAAGAGS